MGEFLKNNSWALIATLFAAGVAYNQLSDVKDEADVVTQDVKVVNQSIAQLNTDVKILDTRTTNDERDIQVLQSKIK